jgi:hypothetical protein
MKEVQNMDEPHQNLLNILVFDKVEIDFIFKPLNLYVLSS